MTIGPRTFGLTMIIIGLLALLLAAQQHRSAIEALKLSYPEREHYPAFRRSNAWLLGILIALLGLLALVSARRSEIIYCRATARWSPDRNSRPQAEPAFGKVLTNVRPWVPAGFVQSCCFDASAMATVGGRLVTSPSAALSGGRTVLRSYSPGRAELNTARAPAALP